MCRFSYDGSLDSYVELLAQPGQTDHRFLRGLQFLLMAYGGICAQSQSGKRQSNSDDFRWG
jgi:hypothetical protein